MAFNFYEGWTEAQLLELRMSVQQELAGGRVTETRLAGNSTRTDDRNSTPLETTLERIAYALWKLNPNSYPNPSANNPGVTLQRYG